MKSKSIRLLSFSLAVCTLLFSLSGCSGKNKSGVDTKRYSDMKFNDSAVNDGLLCENGSFGISWNETYKQVIFTDKKTGKQYSSMPTDTMQVRYDDDGYEINNNQIIESPITVNYYNTQALNESSVVAKEAIDNNGVHTEKIENGIRVIYDFQSLEISVPVEYTIADDHFEITVRPEEISDNGKSFVTGVAIAPFLASVKNDSKNSYIFYPDGSGTVIEPDTIDFIGKKESKRVYGEDRLIYQKSLTSYTNDIRMPVFGVKQQDSAVFGIITSAAEQAYLELNAGAENIGYSAVYPFFRTRGYSRVKQPRRFWKAEDMVSLFDEYIPTTPIKISYYILNGSDADYNGMAKLYRNYLLDNGTIAADKKSDSAVALEILGGLEQKKFTFGIPHTVLKSLTSIEQTRKIAEYFSQNSNSDLLINLVGFGSEGLDIGTVGGGFKIASVFGNKKQTAALTEFCSKQGIDLFMDFDVVNFSKSGTGFSKNADAAKLPNGQTAYFYLIDNVTRQITDVRYSLLSRNCLGDALDKIISSVDKYSISGISLSTLSNSIYSDYDANAKAADGMCNLTVELLKKVGEKHSVLTNNANVYAAGVSDHITHTPTKSSRDDIYTYDIPFYSMVFKGYVPMSSESVNLEVDYNNSVLRCIEAGIAPSFTLMYDYDNTVVSSKFSSLYASDYNGQREKILATINSVNEILQKTSGKEISRHTVLENGLRITEYANGVKIAVNYTDTEISYNGVQVAAGNYKLLEG